MAVRPSSFHIDQLLTTYATLYVQQATNFVAASAFPAIEVPTSSGIFKVFDRYSFMRDEVKPRALGAASEIADFNATDQSYLAQERALRIPIDERVMVDNNRQIDINQAATRMLLNQHLIRLDRQWATTFMKPGVWTTNKAGVTTGPSAGQILRWSQTGSHPIYDIKRAKEDFAELTGYMPNSLVLGSTTWLTLSEHPDLVGRVAYTSEGSVDVVVLARLLGVERVRIARGVYNAAAEGLGGTSTFIVDKLGALLTYSPSNPMMGEPTAGALFAWTGLIPGVNNAIGGIVENYPAAEVSAHSTEINSRTAWGMGLVAPDLGVYFANAVDALT